MALEFISPAPQQPRPEKQPLTPEEVYRRAYELWDEASLRAQGEGFDTTLTIALSRALGEDTEVKEGIRKIYEENKGRAKLYAGKKKSPFRRKS